MENFTSEKMPEGYCFHFSCSVCGGPVNVLVKTEDYSAAVITAQQEGRRLFNRCHICGRWVCDAHYNEAVLSCTKCAPRASARKVKIRICGSCGGDVAAEDNFCRICGTRIQIGKECLCTKETKDN